MNNKPLEDDDDIINLPPSGVDEIILTNQSRRKYCWLEWDLTLSWTHQHKPHQQLHCQGQHYHPSSCQLYLVVAGVKINLCLFTVSWCLLVTNPLITTRVNTETTRTRFINPWCQSLSQFLLAAIVIHHVISYLELQTINSPRSTLLTFLHRYCLEAETFEPWYQCSMETTYITKIAITGS